MIAEQGVLFQLWIVEDLLCKHHKSVPENTFFQCRKIQFSFLNLTKVLRKNTFFNVEKSKFSFSNITKVLLKIHFSFECMVGFPVERIENQWRLGSSSQLEKKCTVERVKDCFDGIPPISFSFLIIIIKC